jgi:hypothetical protein
MWRSRGAWLTATLIIYFCHPLIPVYKKNSRNNIASANHNTEQPLRLRNDVRDNRVLKADSAILFQILNILKNHRSI